MPDRPTISMVMIARDEAKNVRPCFESFWDHVDQVVLLDTGSTDATVYEARSVARDKHQSRKLTVGTFDWIDDFAAARNYANTLATGDWVCWVDLDDEIVGARHLHDIAAAAPAEVQAIMFDYAYATDPHGNTICTLKRERLVRREHSQWIGRVHEAQQLVGGVQIIPGDRVLWRHRKQPDAPTDRNLRILESWAVDEPANPRVVGYLGTERAAQGKHEEAVEAYRRYLELDGEPDEHRAQTWRKLACSLISLGRTQEAFDAGVRGIAESPAWPDNYLTLAQTCYLHGQHDKATEWAQQVLRRGMPATVLIVNPLDYTVEPRVVIAGSLADQGKLDDAVRIAEEALAVAPGHPLLRPAYEEWRPKLKRQKTVDTWVTCARMLVAHDEQAKALALLEDTVPFYATDHPEIVALRSELRERLAFARNPELYTDHYVHGGSKPEDMIPDEKLVDLCERLPRAQFLRQQVQELLAA